METQKKSAPEKDELKELIKSIPKLLRNKEFEIIIKKSRSIAKKTNNHVAYNILGSSLYEVGKPEEAVIYLEKSLQLNQEFLPAYKNLAKSYFKVGNYFATEKVLNVAIKKFPGQTNLLDQMSKLFLMLKDLELACYYLKLSNDSNQTFKKLIKLAEINLEITKNTNSQSALESSLANLHKAFHIMNKEDHLVFYQFAIKFYSRITLSQYSESDIAIFSKILKTNFWGKALPIVRKNFLTTALLKISIKTKSNEEKLLSESDLIKIATLPVLKEVLVLQPYPNLHVEKLLKNIRRSFLFKREKIKNVKALTSLLESIAINSFLTEYLFDYTSDEKLELSKVINSLNDQSSKKQCFDFYVLIILCYKSFIEVNPNKMLKFFEKFSTIKAMFFDAPKKEKNLRKDLKTIGEIKKASYATLEQYEENPYPRWHKYPFQQSFKKFNDFLLTQELNPKNFVLLDNDKKEILIAGCGTGLNVFQVAAGFPGSNITAIDLSISSLAYAKRKVEEAGLEDISFYHADISQISKIKKTYHYIECMGVLHHNKDYLQIWRSLTECLKKNGVMRVGLYSRRAREEIIQFRETLNKNFVGISQDQVIYERQKIIKNNKNFNFTASIDFFSKSGFRDLILNAYEKQFDLLEIKEILKKLNLEFLGIQMKNTAARSEFKKLFPKNDDWFILDNWDLLEKKFPHLFIGMYQFWCQKN